MKNQISQDNSTKIRKIYQYDKENNLIGEYNTAAKQEEHLMEAHHPF